jgi:hypothetical protein
MEISSVDCGAGAKNATIHLLAGIESAIQWTIPQLTEILISTSLDKIPS